MKVVFQYDAGPGLRSKLADLSKSGLSVVVCPVEDRETFAGQMADAEVLWHVLEPVTREVIEQSPQLRLIQKIGVGVNTIDLDAARDSLVSVSNMPGTNSRAVAEAALALMLTTSRRTVQFDSAVREGRGWSWHPDIQDHLSELGGKCVGLVGYGSIPQLLAPILEAMGAEVIYYARSPKPDAVGQFSKLDDLLARADIVSLHLPLTDETENMVDAAAIATMKPGAILVNTARGGLVDEAALVTALTNGQLRAAGLDTFEQEPTPVDNPLLELDNVVVTPHVAWLTTDTLDRSIVVAVENCRRLAAEEPLLHQIM